MQNQNDRSLHSFGAAGDPKMRGAGIHQPLSFLPPPFPLLQAGRENEVEISVNLSVTLTPVRQPVFEQQ